VASRAIIGGQHHHCPIVRSPDRKPDKTDCHSPKRKLFCAIPEALNHAGRLCTPCRPGSLIAHRLTPGSQRIRAVCRSRPISRQSAEDHYRLGRMRYWTRQIRTAAYQLCGLEVARPSLGMKVLDIRTRTEEPAGGTSTTCLSISLWPGRASWPPARYPHRSRPAHLE
jgi:hypothetical protein